MGKIPWRSPEGHPGKLLRRALFEDPLLAPGKVLTGGRVTRSERRQKGTLPA